MPEERGMLFEIDADAAKEDSILRNVWFVSQRWCVERKQRDMMTLFDELCSECIIAETTSAIHSRSTRSDVEDLHQSNKRSPEKFCLFSLRVFASSREIHDIIQAAL